MSCAGIRQTFCSFREYGDKYAINVPLTGEGPDMKYVGQLLAKDKSIKGIICVPKHSNPTGETYSSKVLEELAKLPKKLQKDFMIFYDNAYSVHDFKKIQKIRKHIQSL